MPKPADHVPKRRRWTERQARGALDELARSGLSMREFALREGIKLQRLVRWRSRLKGEAGTRPAPVTFVEVRRRKPERAEDWRESPARQIEVVLFSGRVLRCAEEIDTTVLRRIVGVLEQDRLC